MFTKMMLLQVREVYEKCQDIQIISHSLKMDPVTVQAIVNFINNVS
jgi:hypothetical protein